SCAQSLACDIADNNAQRRAEFDNLEEIARKMADGENLSGHFEFARMKLTRSAEPSLDLRRFEEAALDRRLFAADCGQLFLECADSFAVFLGSEKVFWIHLLQRKREILRLRGRGHAGNLTEPHLVHFEPRTFLRLRQKSANELISNAVHGEEIARILGHGLKL